MGHALGLSRLSWMRRVGTSSRWIGTGGRRIGTGGGRVSTSSGRGSNLEGFGVVTSKVKEVEVWGEVDAQGCGCKLDDNVGGLASCGA